MFLYILEVPPLTYSNDYLRPFLKGLFTSSQYLSNYLLSYDVPTVKTNLIYVSITEWTSTVLLLVQVRRHKTRVLVKTFSYLTFFFFFPNRYFRFGVLSL